MPRDTTPPPLPSRLLAALRNAIELASMGRLEQAERTPYEVAARGASHRLRRYRAESPASRPPLLLVPPLMLTAEVYDIASNGSAVGTLLARGVDPWVIDFGAPERQQGGTRRTLDDHVRAVSDAVDHVRTATGRDVHLGGYSQGGIFVYLTAAYRRCDGVASLVTFGSPVDVHHGIIPGVPDELVLPVLDVLAPALATGFGGASVPAWLTRNVFRMLSPTKELRGQIEFLTSLHDRDALLRREGQRRFLADEGWVAWPGPAFRDFLDQMILGNRLFSGGFVVDGRTLTLADIVCPVLAFVGERDEIARPYAVRSVADAAPRAEAFEVSVEAGHMGLVVGSRAMDETWPTVASWIHAREGQGTLPPCVHRIGQAPPRAAGTSDDEDMGLTERLGRNAATLLVGAVTEATEVLLGVGSSLGRQVPRLARLEGLRRDPRVGLALSLAEQARSHPQDTFFLYEGRAHTFADADRRVDAIVRGLISIGVHTGDHVGILMHTRPTALALATAVNRLGAVAVMLRPDGELAAELAAGGVEHLVTDPEHAAAAVAVWRDGVHVLGGVHVEGRAMPEGASDMERIDPAEVAVPEWYVPSPGKAGDVAFVFFSGSGRGLRANRITNRRWALSAFGTASSAALSADDTVYCWTPIHHPTGLLVSMSGAVAGGARLAMAAGGFSAHGFWEEVRRYGVTVVFYTGTILSALVDAPPDPGERRHPVRLFAGSGMPKPVWERLVDRFGPVGVLEFWASTVGNAVLANVSGKKVGSVGRPLPGSAQVRLVAWDEAGRRPLLDAAGWVRPAGRDAMGMLLARVSDPGAAGEAKPLRNAFQRGDAWAVTGALFRRDADGDFWLVDHATDVILGPSGPIASVPIEDVVGALPGVGLVAAYGVRVAGRRGEVPAVAVVLRPGATLDGAALARAVERLPLSSRPGLVRVVDALPFTAGHRVLKAPLRTAGIPADDVAAGRILVRRRGEQAFVPLAPGEAI